MLSGLITDAGPLGSPWHPAVPVRTDFGRQLAPFVWLLTSPKWAHAGLFDTHADLPAPAVDPDEVERRAWHVPDWHTWALCGGMSFAAFFGAADDERPTMKRSEISHARRICGSCPVTRDCLTWALTQRESFGVWGGTSGRQRTRMHAEMRAGASLQDVVNTWLSQWLTI